MKPTKFIIIFSMAITVYSCCSYRYSLKSEIRGKKLDTYYAQLDIPDDINPRDGIKKAETCGIYDGEYLYTFHVKLSLNENDPECEFIDDSKRAIVKCTAIQTPLVRERCLKIIGAYNKDGAFVARKIVDLTDNLEVVICDW